VGCIFTAIAAGLLSYRFRLCSIALLMMDLLTMLLAARAEVGVADDDDRNVTGGFATLSP
jgi:hypothetical protein